MDEDAKMRMTKPSFKSEISLGAIIQVVMILLALTAGWFNYTNSVENNTKAIVATNESFVEYKNAMNANIIASMLDFEVDVSNIRSANQTAFVRVDNRFDRFDTEIDGIKDDTSALAVSLGKLEAGQSFMQNTLEQILEVSQ